MAISGDTALIGTFLKTVGDQTWAGAAYVFTGSGASWSQQAELTASDAAADDWFGFSMALSGDTALIGASGEMTDPSIGPGAAYVFSVIPPSSVDTLSNLTVNGSTVTGFAPGTTTYDVVLPYGTTTIPTVTATTTDPNATALVSQAASVTGAATVLVTAADAVTQQTYTINFSVAPSSDTAIVSTIGIVNNTALTITALPCATTAAALTAALSSTDGSTQSYAVYEADRVTPVSGALTSGDLLVATAEDGTQASYAITVLPSSDDTLKSLTVSAGTLSPSFASGTLSYADNVANSVAAITVTPTTNDSQATCVLQVGGVTVSNPIALGVGSTVIDVVVCAPSGASQTYSVTVTRAALITPTLTLTLSGLKSGVLKLGKSVTAQGTVTPTSLAGGVVTLTVQRKQNGTWHRVASLAQTITASGTYSGTYKPAKPGSYRIKATMAQTVTNTTATTGWLTFKCIPNVTYVLQYKYADDPAPDAALRRPSRINVGLDPKPYPPFEVLKNLHWSYWRSTGAHATGTMWSETSGGTWIRHSASVWLSRPHVSGRYPTRTLVNPIRYFSRLRIATRLNGGLYVWSLSYPGWEIAA